MKYYFIYVCIGLVWVILGNTLVAENRKKIQETWLKFDEADMNVLLRLMWLVFSFYATAHIWPIVFGTVLWLWLDAAKDWVADKLWDLKWAWKNRGD